MKSNRFAVFTLLSVYVSAAEIFTNLDGFPSIDFAVVKGFSIENWAPGNSLGLKARALPLKIQMLYNLTRALTLYVAEIQVGSDNQSMSVIIDNARGDLFLLSSDIVCIDKAWYNDPDTEIEFVENSKKRSFKDNDYLKGSLQDTSIDQALLDKRDSRLATYDGAIYRTRQTCTSNGSFNTESSSSFHENRTEEIFIAYSETGLKAEGIWGYENIYLGNTQVEQLYLGIAEAGTAQQGVLGLGLMENEITRSLFEFPFTYMNFPARLKSDGIISRNAYSIYSVDGKGSVLFGAIDKAKIDGTLTSFPVVNVYPFNRNRRLFSILVRDLSLSTDSGSNITVTNRSFPVLFYTGTSISYVPMSVLSNIIRALNGRYDSDSEVGVIPCPANNNVELNLKFGDTTYSIPISSLLIENNGECILGILPSNEAERTLVFGGNIIKHLYVVFDADSMEVSVAKVKNSSRQKIVSISSYAGSQAADYSQTSYVDNLSSNISVDSALSYSTGNGLPTESSEGKVSETSTIKLPLSVLFMCVFVSLVLIIL